jgi:hypothetical protein
MVSAFSLSHFLIFFILICPGACNIKESSYG